LGGASRHREHPSLGRTFQVRRTARGWMLSTRSARPCGQSRSFSPPPPFILEIVKIVHCSLLHSLWRFLDPGRVEEWHHTRRSGLSVAPRLLWESLTNRTVAGFHPPPRRTERADFPHFLLASQEDLWDVAHWWCFQS